MDLANIISVSNNNQAVGNDPAPEEGEGEDESVREEEAPSREDQCGRVATLVLGGRSLPAPGTSSPCAGASPHLSSSS